MSCGSETLTEVTFTFGNAARARCSSARARRSSAGSNTRRSSAVQDPRALAFTWTFAEPSGSSFAAMLVSSRLSAGMASGVRKNFEPPPGSTTSTSAPRSSPGSSPDPWNSAVPSRKSLCPGTYRMAWLNTAGEDRLHRVGLEGVDSELQRDVARPRDHEVVDRADARRLVVLGDTLHCFLRHRADLVGDAQLVLHQAPVEAAHVVPGLV